jgi:hypothetical protein
LVGLLTIIQVTNSGYMRAMAILFGPIERLSLCFESRQYVVRVILDDIIGDRASLILAFGPGLDEYDAHAILPLCLARVGRPGCASLPESAGPRKHSSPGCDGAQSADEFLCPQVNRRAAEQGVQRESGVLSPTLKSRMAMLGKTWQVSYGGVSVPCKTEKDAKLLARELVKKGHRVKAETLEGQNPVRSIEPHQIAAWLVE